MTTQPGGASHGRDRARRAAPLAPALFASALLATACAHAERGAGVGATPERAPPAAEERSDRTLRETGLASYYSHSLEGHQTASGVRYDGRAMTCAHRSLPFGTVLRVTDTDTGKHVRVKVTDRGPFTRGRVVDLSWAAARELGILERGVARVTIEVVRED